MPAPWQTWKKTLSCKADLDEVHEPKAVASPSKGRASKSRRSNKAEVGRSVGGGGPGHGRSLKDVIHGNTRVMHKQQSWSCSPDSGSSDYFNTVMADEVMMVGGERGLLGAGGISYYCGTPLSSSYVYRGTPLRCSNMAGGGAGAGAGADSPFHDSPKLGCHKCGRLFNKLEALEQHQIVHHAVTELNPGDSSRNVVEIIFRTSWLKKELPCGNIHRILKVHNTQRTINKFEEYRDGVKARAAKLAKKHPRCLADGNELLRFYGTTLACSLGFNGSSSLCTLPACNVCHIISSGFPHGHSHSHGHGHAARIHTTSTSGKAHDCIPWPEDDELVKARRAMVLCRVIAGRVHMEEAGAGAGAGAVCAPPGFDSLSADPPAPYSNMQHLLVFNSTAVLPCFVVIYSL